MQILVTRALENHFRFRRESGWEETEKTRKVVMIIIRSIVMMRILAAVSWSGPDPCAFAILD